jgi:hypothetical protein
VGDQATESRKHDQFDDESWPLALAAAWIIWRSRERVASVISAIIEKERHLHIFDVFNHAARTASAAGGPPHGGVLPFQQAQGELWGQLKSGRLAACGIRVGESAWGQLAPGELDPIRGTTRG